MTDPADRREPAGDAAATAREMELAAIVQSSDDVIIGKGPDGRITSWNPAAEHLYGYTAAEAVGQPIAIIEPPERAGETADILGRVMAGERLDHYETQRLAKDGRLVEVSLTVSPIRAPDGRILGASAIAREIGERRRAEQYRDTLLALTQVLAESSTLEEAAPQVLSQLGHSMGWDVGAMWLVDEEGEALSVAFRWCRSEAFAGGHEGSPDVTRFAPGEGLPGGVWSSGEPAWVADVSRDPSFPRSDVIAGEEVRGAIGLPIWCASGVLGVLEFFSRDLRRPDTLLSDLLTAVGGQVGAFVERARAWRAVSEAKAESERANQAKSEFLSRMSHELRTPLNAILGFGQLLELDGVDQEQRESVAQILKAGRHLLELIDEVLDIARIEAGQLRLSLEPVAVAELIEESLSLVRPLADGRRIRLEAELDDAASRWALADRQRLKQVLLNLLSNAIKYNRERGSVRVRLEPSGDERLAILVSDTGPGISPEQHERLFEPFDRLGAEGSGVEGTGLGLALSKRLVEAMGGALTAASEPGRGTTMSVDLACAEAVQRAERTAEAAPQAALGGRTLLYIEDNLANLRLVERLLERFAGVRVLPAMQGKLGLDLAREHRPDLVLLDLHLPDLPGREVLARLKAEPALRDTPVVIVSADATERESRRMLAAGAHAYLTKPLDIRRFLAIVEECLGEGGSPP